MRSTHTHMQRYRHSQNNHKNADLKAVIYKQKTSKVKKKNHPDKA